MIVPKHNREFKVLGLGEVMLRLSPVGKERISYCETFEKMAGGSELNVVSGISMLGMRTGVITKLPHNEIGKFIKHKIRFAGTSDDFVVYDDRDDRRLGVYYYEYGAFPRVPVVSYDRKGSSFTSFKASELPDSVYESCDVFHTSGITLGLCPEVRDEAMSMMRRFYSTGALISFDVNYRAALWDEATAKATIEQVLPLIDVLFISEETLRRMFGMTGELRDIHKGFAKKYKNLKVIASTKRTVITPQRHSFTSLVYDTKEDRHFEEEPYDNIEVVDRIGSGDAYVAGALYGMLTYGSIDQMAIFGDAMAAMKNTVIGDMTVCDLTDVNRIIKAHRTDGPNSEMVR